MRFYIVCIGKLKDAYLREGVAEFVKRMRPYGGITITELNESKIGDKPSDADRKQVVAEEGDRLLKAVPKNAYTVLLDVYGKTMSSEELAKTVSKLEVDGVSDMAFIIGGAFGVSDTLRQAVNYKLSKEATLQFGVQNVFNRVFFSDEATAGRTYSASMKFKF